MEDSVSVQILSAVAVKLETDPLDLPPLNDAIDVEALEALFESCTNGECALELRFTYAGCAVTVSEDAVSLGGSTDESAAEQD